MLGRCLSNRFGTDSRQRVYSNVTLFGILMTDEAVKNKVAETQENNSEQDKWPSYTMVEERMKQIYFRFYKATYKSSKIDRKTKELIAIAASLGFQCEGCLEGHVQKAIQYGATKEEISEAICISMGVAAASVVDQTDVIAQKIQCKFFD